ncbi:MAG TPA: FAD-dependent oxidoreductase [Candidatus Methylomirabilis sp.]|nr:FAD-dependent oxidoreductase [Candidatus Methylomirabilis sp.]HSC71345.1 FAD-dependent oxidoreductase [Candidatus Methylomirabilis sp.]
MRTGADVDPGSAPVGWDAEYDVVVLGAGAGGMTAALVSAIQGMRTILIEKSDQVGGTTAYSSGSVWIPNNPDQRRHGITGDAEAGLEYLDALVDGRADRALRQAFLAAGPEMLEYLEQHTDVRFQMYRQAPDYRQELPGAAQGGRPLEPLPFDGRTLGKEFDRVRWPIRELMLFGGMMVTRGEAARLLRIGRSWDSFVLGARLVTRFLCDRLRYRRGTRLVLGNALSARLFRNLLDRRVAIWFNARTTRLISEGGRACGLVVLRDGSEARVRARRGIVLAGGGFPGSPELRERYFPKPVAQHTSAFEGCEGETLLLAQEIGASLGPLGEDNAFWFPGSIAPRKDGSTTVYPHIVLDRSKPGLVAVNSAGRRFVNEAVAYHEFVRAMYRSHRKVPSIPAMLVCDRRFVWKYGLGMIRPLTPLLKPYVDRGYLHVAGSVEELARKIGVDATGLAETIRAQNEYARTGIDAEFGKGNNTYDRSNGDPAHTPNPCLGPIRRPPYCAVAVLPTPLGTSLGVRTDAHGQVLDGSGRPIGGLYACGNDMHSIMGGEYPGAGAQLGLAMTFGYLAAKHAAGGGQSNA